MINSLEIKKKFLDFFRKNNHAIIPSASIVPENDSSVLFNTAWMQALVPYLLWEKHPSWKRLANLQKCIRTWDIDEVWDNTHLTFFEMLWNWSLWDYFKEESIKLSYDFLISKDYLALDPNMLAFTVFNWDNDAPRDEESANIWLSLWISKDRISYLWKKDNWWAAWDSWPCWPDTEIFYRIGEEERPKIWSNVWNDEKNWMEIWNNVFMEYNRLKDGSLEKLPFKNVDTGMWIERLTSVLNKATSFYETDIFDYIIYDIEKKLNIQYNNKNKKSIRIIADHIRTAIIMISDWVIASNVDQWYVLRRLIRRAIREAYKLSYKWVFLSKIAPCIIDKLSLSYENIKIKEESIIQDLLKEENQFALSIWKWLKEFENLVIELEKKYKEKWIRIDSISWKEAFKLYDTYWFPIEMTEEMAKEKGLFVDKEWFYESFKQHQDLSRVWSEVKFKWWLSDDWYETVALHSATHLLLAWLRKYLWEHVHQKWSNINSERLRFDFSHDDKIDKEILIKVENYVNEAINSNLKVSVEYMDKQKAQDSWMEWSFWEKYPDIVKVYSMIWENDIIYSRELCWWPHIENSNLMGVFKIIKEEAVSKWARRIKAILKR